MDVFWRKGQVEDALTWKFEHQYRNKGVALTGILLARPEDPLTRDAILPDLDYWSRRSAEWVDFFCVGYLPRWFADSTGGLPPVVTVGNGEWAFARAAFVELLEDIESTAGITYDGSPSLLLLNSYFDGSRNRARLDYSRILWINFREALVDKAISTPTQLAELVFHFVKQANEHHRERSAQDPIWEFSDGVGRKILKRTVVDALLGFLPESIRPNARRAVHFVVKEKREMGGMA